MDRTEIGKLEYDLHIVERANYDRIRELIGHDEFFKIADQDDEAKGVSIWKQNTRHDLWLRWVNELEDRLNWEIHLNYMMGMIRQDEFDPDRIKWTIEDYVYNR